MTGQMLHATAVAINGDGILLMGTSGSGKSDLALRLIDRGAMLISDDAVSVETSSGNPILVAAPNIAGKLEIRGVGICDVGYLPSAPLRLLVQLVMEVERMPLRDFSEEIAGYRIPLVKLDPWEASAAIKLEYALGAIVDAGHSPVAIRVTDERESIEI